MAACEATVLGSSATISGTVDITGQVDSVPQGISTGIKRRKPTITDASWTLIGGITGRRSLVIINTSNSTVYVANDAFDALPVDPTDGFDVLGQTSARFDATEDVHIYARLASGAGSVTIKAMEFV